MSVKNNFYDLFSPGDDVELLPPYANEEEINTGVVSSVYEGFVRVKIGALTVLINDPEGLKLIKADPEPAFKDDGHPLKKHDVVLFVDNNPEFFGKIGVVTDVFVDWADVSIPTIDSHKIVAIRRESREMCVVISHGVDMKSVLGRYNHMIHNPPADMSLSSLLYLATGAITNE